MIKNLCAVEGCNNEGVSHQCLGDGGRHHHGRIHYDCPRVDAAGHGLTFRKDAWHYLCLAHYAQIKTAMKAKGLLPENVQ